MAIGFRRSVTRLSGRTVVAFVAIAVAGQGGLGAPGGSSSRPPLADLAQPAAPAIAVVPLAPVARAPSTAEQVTPVSADLAAFEPAPDVADAGAVDDPTAAAAGLQPTIHFEEAERHANDKTAFHPGGRVTVGFAPHPGDRWTVGGVSPTALPAGRLDGIAIRGQGGTTRADRPTRTDDRGRPAGRDPAVAASVDLPSGGPSPLAATSASFQGGTAVGTAEEPVTPEAAISSNGLRREIFGFLPYWEVNSSSLRLDYRKISTIAYFGVGADGAGNLQKRNSDGSTTVGWSGWTSSKMTSIISAAHASHTRVVLTVQSFAWNTSGLARQRALLGSSRARLNLARQIAAAVRDRGADGVNLDFEPLASTYDAEFTALVRTIRTELNRIHRGYQITFDTTGSIGNYPIANATAPGGADAIFIMGYDYRSGRSSPVGSVAPLRRTGYDIEDTIRAYRAKVPASKLILGVPYYGRAWSTSSSAVHATNTSSTRTGASTTVIYDTAADYLAEHGRRYEATEQVAWTAYRRENCTSTYGCVTSWRQLYIDDATALKAKYDLVNSYGLRGAGIWALGYDGTRPELWAAIQTKFVTDTTAPRTGVTTLASRQLNPAFTVRWIGRDDVSVASYDVQVSTNGGAWVAWLKSTRATAATWSGIDGHDYAFRVRARDPKGNLSAWNVAAKTAAAGAALKVGGFGLVRIDGLSIRSTADSSATRLGTYDRGDLVAVVGGPIAADGFTWFRVVGPLTEWGPAGPTSAAAWVAAGGSGSTWLAPATAPHATRVSAALGDLAFGNAGRASVGTAASAVGHRAFSPNRNGSRDTLTIDWTNDRAMGSLVLRVFRADGRLLGNIPLGQRSAGPQQASWNGKVGSLALPNGRYLVALVGAAGGSNFANPGPTFTAKALATFGVTIDTVAPTVSAASISTGLISPNGDGIRDAVTARLSSNGATGWTFSAARLTGSTVGPAVTTRSGTGASAAVTWNGRSNAGAVVADGSYRLTLAAVDHAGNRTARSWTVRVDHTAARVTMGATPAAISPNGDGSADKTRLAWTSSERISGTARIYRGTSLVRSWAIVNVAAGAVAWSGTNAAGSLVADGTYSFRVTGRDAAGNLSVRAMPVVVDRTLAALRWSRSAFYPHDGDAIAPSARLTFSLKRSAVVTVGIYAGSTLVRTVWTNRSFAAGGHGFTWNGRNSAGLLVPRGTYQVRVSAKSSLGTTALTRSVVVDAFRTALSATSLKAGQTLTVTVTTVEGLRSSPTISLTQAGRAAVSRTATALGSGRYRVTFTVAAGGAGTATIRITGRDTAGGLNASSRTVTIR